MPLCVPSTRWGWGPWHGATRRCVQAVPIAMRRLRSTTGTGLAIDRVHPENARIWAGVAPVAGCAATSQCQSMLLFCNPGHHEDWRKTNAPNGRGYNLSPAQALQLGAAIFRPFLDGY
ncbi:MAG: hypothetical protein COC12_13300 [Rhodobacteraceae bacterium]|nr:MAG: hypothetical protein COC12_13300 [Paracoccaceae bacterium]